MWRFKSKIVGFVLVLCMMVSAYTVVVQAVQQFGDMSLISRLSMFGSDDAGGNRTQFCAGEMLSIRVNVSAGDIYTISIYGKNGSVYSQQGWIHDHEALVQVLLDPPGFSADQSYIIVFSAYISVYPIPGAFASDTRVAVFNVAMACTKLYLTSAYNDNSYWLSLHVSLENENGNPVANRTISFYLQPNCSAGTPDRGWISLTTASTDADGCISLPLVCKLYGGLHYIMAKFKGDSDFGESENVTKFYTPLRTPRLSITRVSSSLGQTDVSVKAVDQQGCPLFGKILTANFGNSAGAQNFLGTTDENGEITTSFNCSTRQALNQSVFTIKQDLFTSGLSTSFRNLTQTKNLGTLSSSVVEYSTQPENAANYQGVLTFYPLSSNHPYAVLPMLFCCKYNNNLQANSSLAFYFYLDGTYLEGSLLWSVGASKRVYVGQFWWSPDVTGSHFMEVRVVNEGTLLNQADSENFTVKPCPCNLRIYTPQVTYGNSANVTVVFSMPSVYNQNSSSYFYSYDLAPGFNYNGTVYKINSGLNDVTLRLYCNCTDIYLRDVSTEANGHQVYNLSVCQGDSEAENWSYTQLGTVATWGIRVWVGNKELTNYTPAARVHRSVVGQGLQNGTWNLASALNGASYLTLSPSDSIVVAWYVGKGSSPSTWRLLANSTTGPFGATRLNASIWTVSYYTSVAYSETVQNKYDYGLAWGASAWNTRIMNFTYPPSSGGFTDMNLALINGASTGVWPVNLLNCQRLTYNFKLQVVNPVFQQNITSRTITFSRVSVNANNGNNFLRLNCSLNTANESQPQVYAGINTTISASVSLFNQPVYDANTYIVTGFLLSASQTGVNGGNSIQIDDCENFLHVVSICNNAGDYLPVYGAWACFSLPGGRYRNASLDSGGCVWIPRNADAVRMGENGQPVNATIEFLDAIFVDESLRTDASGVVETSWTPDQVGCYLLEVWLLSSFDTVVSQPPNSTSVSESVCLVKYVQAVGRPLTLSLAPTSPSGGTTYSMNITACSRTFIWNGYYQGTDYSGTNFCGAPDLVVCTGWDSYLSRVSYLYIEGQAWIFLNFNLYSLFKTADIISATLTMYPIDYDSTLGSGYYPQDSVRTYGVFAVQDPWSNRSLCWNNADTDNGYYNTPSEALATKTVNVTSPVYGGTYMSNVTWDLTSAFQSMDWNKSKAFVYGFMIKDMNYSWQDQGSPYIDFNSSQGSAPMLNIEFTVPSTVGVCAYDSLLSQTVSGLQIGWSLNSVAQSSVVTSGGCANLQVGNPLTGSVGVYNVTASYDNVTDSYAGGDEYASANGSWVYDNRWGGNMTCLQGDMTNATRGGLTTLSFHLYSSELCGIDLPSLAVEFYINGRPQSGEWTTDPGGQVSFSHAFSQVKTYIVTACFVGTGIFGPCNASVTVTVVPLAVLFSVSPSEFDPSNPTQLTLNATIMDTRYNTRFTGSCTVEFFDVKANNIVTSLLNKTTLTGVATLSVTYPSDNLPHAYEATVMLTGGTAQSLISSPVQLTAGKATRLLLNVTRDFGSTRHVFTCRLFDNSPGSGLNGRVVTLKLNNTVYTGGNAYPTLITNQTGYAWLALSLTPTGNGNLTYSVVASFGGDHARSVTATMTTLNGTTYDVCTTTQYYLFSAVGYEPSSNSTSITVTPQTTLGATTLMNMAQMEKNQEAPGGGLSVYPEFSWWYPWFRLHFKITVGDPTTIDAGVSLLPSGSTQSSKNLDIFSQLNAALVSGLVLEAGIMMTEYAAAKIGFWEAPWISAIFLTIEAGMDFGLLLAYWDNKDALLAFGIVNIIMGLIATQGNIAMAFLNLLTMVNAAIMAALMLITTGTIAGGGPSVLNPVNPAQVGLSFTFAAWALIRWAGMR